MDPRPYHFDYRKPRLSNPTLYQLHNQASHRISMRACSQLKMFQEKNLWRTSAILRFITDHFHNKTSLKCKKTST